VNVAGYRGEDLYMAQPLAGEILQDLYAPPSQQFQAGLGFRAQEAWLDVVGANVELKGYIGRGGYSEYMRDWETGVPAVRRENNPEHTQTQAEFVTAQVSSLLGVGAIERVTHMQDEVGEVRVVAPLTVAVQDGGKRRSSWNGRPTNVGVRCSAIQDGA